MTEIKNYVYSKYNKKEFLDLEMELIEIHKKHISQIEQIDCRKKKNILYQKLKEKLKLLLSLKILKRNLKKENLILKRNKIAERLANQFEKELMRQMKKYKNQHS